MSEITQILGQKKISIASVIQRETNRSNQLAEVVIMTHKATEKELYQSISQLQKLVGVNEVATVIRLEE
jgi:homoserine dehydrogenase